MPSPFQSRELADDFLAVGAGDGVPPPGQAGVGDQGVCAVVGVDKARLLRVPDPVGEGDGVAGVGPVPASLLRAGFFKKAKRT